MNISKLLMTMCIVFSFQLVPPSALFAFGGGGAAAFSEDVIRERLAFMSGEIAFTYHPEVRKKILSYGINGIHGTRNMLERADGLMPLVEHYLLINGLPQELKYLPLIESQYRPSAVSPMGAAGLWQFMRGTARDYGLRITSYTDERKDPVRSTEAAVRYLSGLYDTYGDWSLVLAAYNCGPGNVNRAIRYAGSNDYWKLRRYLPAETQRYVPNFIAAAYIANYYQEHGIELQPSDLMGEQLLPTRIHHRVSLSEIARITGISHSQIQRLNPSITRGWIPSSERGVYVMLPESAVRQLEREGWHIPPTAPVLRAPFDSVRSSYTVNSGDSLYRLADLFECSVENLRQWNYLADGDVYPGQELTVYFPR